MILNESYKIRIKYVLVADPVPREQENSTTPCGTFRHLIWQFCTPETTVICIQYVQYENGWNFLKIERYLIEKLYSHPYVPKEGLWD